MIARDGYVNVSPNSREYKAAVKLGLVEVAGFSMPRFIPAKHPWNWTEKEVTEAYQDYRSDGGELDFAAWLYKHWQLVKAVADDDARMHKLADELFVAAPHESHGFVPAE